MDNLHIYEQCRAVPANAIKKISAGNLKGYSDINPVWRIKKLTEIFGPVGFGWYTDTVKEWTEQGANGEVLFFTTIKLFVKQGDEWSKGIEGKGGNKLINKFSKGLTSNDEALKMAETDALSVACKKLGIGADIYWEKDKTKYNNDKDETLRGKTEKETGRKFNDVKKQNKIELSDEGKKILKKLKVMLWGLSEKDENKTLDLLEIYTTFEGREGKKIVGVRDFDKMSEKRILVTYKKVKEVYESALKQAV